MKRILTIVLALAGTLTLWGYSPRVNDISIKVTLSPDGTALVTERWDVVVAGGTEWYLARENLGDIEIGNLGVTDEQGNVFLNEGGWDVDRDIRQKARRCGLHRTSRGYEICWGVESYGPHTWTVSYTMSNAVKSLADYDMLHIQFISDELSSPPQNATLTLSAPAPLSDANSRIWGFGFEGEVNWSDGKVVARSTEPFVRESSMILLVRFDKGIFSSQSVQDRNFDEVLNRALQGNTFRDDGEDDDDVSDALAYIATFLVMWFVAIKPFIKAFSRPKASKREKRKRLRAIFGQSSLPSNPDWSRDVPFGGNAFETYYVASHLDGEDDGRFSIISALILKFVNTGVVQMGTGSDGKKEFRFNDKACTASLSEVELSFLKMLKEASGSDKILQEKEFAKWSRSHQRSVRTWVDGLKSKVVSDFKSDSLADGGSYESLSLNSDGNARAVQALGFRRFLKDFTLMEQRHVPEVALWGDYLVVAALFGIADKLAREMDRLVPGFRLAGTPVTYGDLSDVIVFSDVFRNATRTAYRASTLSSGGGYSGGSSGGWGGHTSFGGGGGFSGGGHGGGSR